MFPHTRICCLFAEQSRAIRVRHVKCDEKKPSCHRCKSTGRKCDWKRPTHPEFGPNVVTATVRCPSRQFPGTLDESKYFQFFCTKTTRQLSGLFGCTFWSQEVLQACVSQPAVWHAAVAVASLQQERSATISKVAEEDEPLSDFTLSQYVKAMQHLRGLYSEGRKPAAEVVLLCCIFFICFEVGYKPSDHPLKLTNMNSLFEATSPPHLFTLIMAYEYYQRLSQTTRLIQHLLAVSSSPTFRSPRSKMSPLSSPDWTHKQTNCSGTASSPKMQG